MMVTVVMTKNKEPDVRETAKNEEDRKAKAMVWEWYQNTEDARCCFSGLMQWFVGGESG